MLDLYTHIKTLLAADKTVGVYACTGLSAMEGVLDDVRETIYPCVMVDVGEDGTANFSDTRSVKTTQTIFVLDRLEGVVSADEIHKVLVAAKEWGLALSGKLCGDSFDHSSACYGLDRSGVGFYSVGPIASCYGYCFTFTFTRDHE